MARPTRTMLIVGAVVVAALIGGGVTYLATAAAAQTTTSSAAADPGAAKARHGKAGRADGAGMLGKVEHGEFTTASAEVMAVQRGAITAIDAASLTVRSSDGYTASYVVTPNTTVGRAGKMAGRRAAAAGAGPGAAAVPGAGAAPGDLTQLHTGDAVQVMATKTDSGVTATRVSPEHA